MTPMRTPELPPEAMYWNAFNEADSLAIIMRAQNYINNELIRMVLSFKYNGCRNKRIFIIE